MRFKNDLTVPQAAEICGVSRNTVENVTIIRKMLYNRIKTQLKPKERRCFWKKPCIYDDVYRLKIMFSHA